MSSPDPRSHERIGGGVRNNNAVWDRVREDAVLAGNFSNFSQNPAIKQHLLGTDTKRLAKASRFDPVWGIGPRADDPKASNPRRWPGKKYRKISFCRPRRQSHKRSCWQTPPPLIDSALRPRPTELMRFLERRACPGPPSEFRHVFLTHRRTTAPRSWLSHLVSTFPSRCQNTAPVSSVASLRSTMLLSPRRWLLTAELTPSRFLVALRSLTLVPHILSSGTTCWVACSRWGPRPPRANGNAFLAPGVVLANLPRYKLRRASARASNCLDR